MNVEKDQLVIHQSVNSHDFVFFTLAFQEISAMSMCFISKKNKLQMLSQDVCVLSHSVVLTLCSPMDCDPPGKNTRVGCHFLLQEIFPTQGLNLCLLRLLYWQPDSLPLSHLGSPKLRYPYQEKINLHTDLTPFTKI